MPDSETCIPLYRRGEFLWLAPHNHEQHESLAEGVLSSTVYAPGSRETAETSLLDWHEALGHPHPASVLFLEQRGLIKVRGAKYLDDFNCKICKEAKSTTPHYQRGTRSIKVPGEVVHVDLVGPFEPDMSGNKYMMVFIDEATRFKSVLGLENKGNTHRLLRTYVDVFQTSGFTVGCIRGDGAGELGRSRVFRQELKNLALQWESSPPYTHQQQGLVERAIRQIVEGGRTQLARSYLGNDFWFYACQDFTFKSNCLP
ncbi:MAG: DDE-type integrase/transposase/recombinase, partial [Gammaproteobacteria bacterium]|nr:DDE-type integrase/transposase/recombinase [Gammaproteobacteria bacterium]